MIMSHLKMTIHGLTKTERDIQAVRNIFALCKADKENSEVQKGNGYKLSVKLLK